MVVEATNTKAPIQRIADTVSGYFVPGIMIIAVFTFVFSLIFGHSLNECIISFVTVLVVACPCALGLATPLAVVVSEGRSAKEGILIKTSEILENANKIDTIVFDKTGTLTYGNLRISKVYCYTDILLEEVLKLVASLEHQSTHPIARAFADYFDSNVKVTKFQNISGKGLYGMVHKKELYVGNSKLLKDLNLSNEHSEDEENLMKDGNSILYVIYDKKIIALIGVKDVVRENAKETIQHLKRMNKDIIMLSGDNEKTANIVAEQLGIDHVIANVMPKEKEKTLKELMEKGHSVMMVGDGINDAPSLASSTIGVSINGGTDIAGDSADVILMQDDLSKIIPLFHISRKTIRIIKENLFWAFIYNLLMIPIAMGFFKKYGIQISPMFASIAMIISSLTVVLNSLRLRKVK